MSREMPDLINWLYLEPGDVAVHRGGRVGMFAELHAILGGLLCADRQGFRLSVEVQRGFYSTPGCQNWFERYFKPIREDGPPRTAICRQDAYELCKWAQCLDLETRVALLPRFVPRAEYLDAALAFIDEQRPDIGLHFRGTDKVTEGAVYVPPRFAAQWLPPGKRVFVATDCAHWLRDFAELYPGDVIAHDHLRSITDMPLHKGRGSKPGRNPDRVGRETVLDWLTLSECPILHNSHGNFSAFAALRALLRGNLYSGSIQAAYLAE